MFKALITILLLCLVGCSSDQGSGDNPSPETKKEVVPKPGPIGQDSQDPQLMVSVNPELLDKLRINYRVTNEQAQAVIQWVMQCRPALTGDLTLTDHAIETLDDGSEKYYRFFPIFAKVDFVESTDSVIKSNPRGYNIDLKAVTNDPQAAPCDLPDDYEIIGYVTALTPFAKDGQGETSDNSSEEPVCEDDTFSVTQPDNGTSFEYSSVCKNGVTQRELIVHPGNSLPVEYVNTSLSGNLSNYCEILQMKVEQIEELEPELASTSNEKHKKIIKEIIDDYTQDLEKMSKDEAMRAQPFIDFNKQMQKLVDDYKELNQASNLTIRLGNASVSQISLALEGGDVNPILQRYINPVPVLIPGGIGHGAVSGISSIPTIMACVLTDFKGEKEDVNHSMLKFNIEYY